MSSQTTRSHDRIASSTRWPTNTLSEASTRLQQWAGDGKGGSGQSGGHLGVGVHLAPRALALMVHDAAVVQPAQLVRGAEHVQRAVASVAAIKRNHAAGQVWEDEAVVVPVAVVLPETQAREHLDER